MSKAPLLFALAGMMVAGVAVAVILLADTSAPVPIEAPSPVQPAPVEPTAAEAPLARPLPAESTDGSADLHRRLAELEARVAELERAREAKIAEEQAVKDQMVSKLHEMRDQMDESRINRNLEKAAKKLAELKAERKSRVESGQKAATGYWKRKYGYSDEQGEKISAPVTDYLDKRAEAMQAMLEAYLSAGGRSELNSERAALDALDAELMEMLDHNFEPNLATTLLEKAKQFIRMPYFLRKSEVDPLKALDGLLPK